MFEHQASRGNSSRVRRGPRLPSASNQGHSSLQLTAAQNSLSAKETGAFVPGPQLTCAVLAVTFNSRDAEACSTCRSSDDERPRAETTNERYWKGHQEGRLRKSSGSVYR